MLDERAVTIDTAIGILNTHGPDIRRRNSRDSVEHTPGCAVRAVYKRPLCTIPMFGQCIAVKVTHRPDIVTSDGRGSQQQIIRNRLCTAIWTLHNLPDRALSKRLLSGHNSDNRHKNANKRYYKVAYPYHVIFSFDINALQIESGWLLSIEGKLPHPLS